MGIQIGTGIRFVVKLLIWSLYFSFIHNILLIPKYINIYIYIYIYLYMFLFISM